MAIFNLYARKYRAIRTPYVMRPRLLTINCKFAVDFFSRGLHTRTAVARLPLRQLGFLVILVVNMNRPCNSHSCRDIEPQIYRGHVTSSATWPLDSHLWCFLIDCQFEPTVYIARLSRDWASKISGSRFDLLGHVTSSVMWPLDSQYGFPIGSQYEPTM